VLVEPLLTGLVRSEAAAAGSEAESATAVVARRALIEGYLLGAPSADGRIIVGNLLAYSLVARATAPSAEELAQAVVLANELEAALMRNNVAAGWCVGQTRRTPANRSRQVSRPAGALRLAAGARVFARRSKNAKFHIPDF